MFVGFVVIRVHEIRCGHVHGRRRLDDDLIGVDVRSHRVDNLVQGSGVLFVDIPRDLVEVVEGNFFWCKQPLMVFQANPLSGW